MRDFSGSEIKVIPITSFMLYDFVATDPADYNYRWVTLAFLHLNL